MQVFWADRKAAFMGAQKFAGLGALALVISVRASVTLVPPVDDDADTAVTARTDCNGATVRPPRVTLLHAVDSARNADLVGGDRIPMDRYAARSERAGRLPNTGHSMRVYAFSSRAGDAFAWRELLLQLSLSSRRFRLSDETTNRTDCNGTTLRVPTWRLFHAADSALNSALTAGGSDRDRFRTIHDIDAAKSTGYVHRVQLVDDGRAGNASVMRELLLRVNLHRTPASKAAET